MTLWANKRGPIYSIHFYADSSRNACFNASLRQPSELVLPLSDVWLSKWGTYHSVP